MFNPKEFVKELINSGLTEEEALLETKNELKKRKLTNKRQIKITNDNASWFRIRKQIYRR